MSAPAGDTIAPDTPALETWPRAVMASIALLISLLTTHLVRLTWFDAPPPQPLNQPAPVWQASPALALAGDQADALRVLADLTLTPFADSIFAALGTPTRLGLVGTAGRDADHIGEFIRSRDSVALAPEAIYSAAQLEHALIHELAHLWLAHRPDAAIALSLELPPLEDASRYGFGDRDEQSAEAVAHAVQYWRASARAGAAPAQLRLLAAYEAVMPGTTAALALLESDGAFDTAGPRPAPEPTP